MCGRFAQRHTWQQIHEHLSGFLAAMDVEGEAPPVTPRYNVSPGQMVLAIRGTEPSHPVQLKWGLIPSWAKDPKIDFSLLNARSETVVGGGSVVAGYFYAAALNRLLNFLCANWLALHRSQPRVLKCPKWTFRLSGYRCFRCCFPCS
jgi:hypothetical protein